MHRVVEWSNGTVAATQIRREESNAGRVEISDAKRRAIELHEADQTAVYGRPRRAAFMGQNRDWRSLLLDEARPVLSEVFDIITTEMPNPFEESFWSKHISPPSNWEVSLRSDAGTDSLSEAEEDKINEVWEEFGQHAPFALVDLLHNILPEWQEVKSGRIPLPYRDILLSKMGIEASKRIEEEMEAVAAAHRVLCAY